MSIFSAPSFYGAADRAIYDAGNYFIPQEQYRGAFNITPAATATSGAAAATGINTVLNQGGGGGGGNNPFNPDMNQIRTDFRPDTEFRRFQDFGITSLDDATGMQRKEMDMYPEFYGINTGVPKTGIAGLVDKAMGFLPGIGFLSRVAPAIQNILPVNERAILENQLRGQGVLTDDIGRIVAGPGGYNTPEGIMAGYNVDKMTGETFDKRTENMRETLKDKYGLTDTQVDGLISGELDEDDFTGSQYQLPSGKISNLFSNIRNIELAKQNFLTQQKKSAEIAAFKEAQRKAKAAEKERQKAFKDARNARDSDNDGVPDYVEDAGGSYDGGYHGAEGGFESTGSGSTPGTSDQGYTDSGDYAGLAKGGRVPYMMGGLADLVDIYD